MSLLHWACDRGHVNVTQALLDHKADVNVLDAEGQTPLHYGKAPLTVVTDNFRHAVLLH